ncbi:MAG: hypothetical protein WDO14_19155 [Bacteroidota bacterium]
MKTENSNAISKVGRWSAFLSLTFSLTYIVGQLAEWLGLLGSDGGPESASTATGLVILLTPSLFLGIAFLILMVSVHYHASEDKKIWSHIALVFATIYATLISINYYVQLTLVVPHLLQNEIEGIRPFLFTPFDSFLYSVDVLGYSFMSLSTLFAAFVFTKKDEVNARWFMIANGLLVPFLALQIYYHVLIWPASLWGITFPGSMIALGRVFGKR